MTEASGSDSDPSYRRIAELQEQYVGLGSAQPEVDDLRRIWGDVREVAVTGHARSVLLGTHVALDLAHSDSVSMYEAQALAGRANGFAYRAYLPHGNHNVYHPDSFRSVIARALMRKQFIKFDADPTKPQKIMEAERSAVDTLRDAIMGPGFWLTAKRPEARQEPVLRTGHHAIMTHLLVARHNVRNGRVQAHSWPSFLRQEKAENGWSLAVSGSGFYAQDATKLKLTAQKTPESEGDVVQASMGDDFGMVPSTFKVAKMLAHEGHVCLDLEALRRASAPERARFAVLQQRIDIYGKNILAHAGVL